MNYTGNPLSYRDGMSFAWENGRILKSISTGDNTLTMKYDSNGMRTQKDDKDYTTSYYYDSNNNLIGIKVHGTVLYFYYDSEGNATSFSHNGTKYYYVKNLQGDVVKIINHLGNVVVTYTYDAWGKILNQTDSTAYNLANINPFRYRGYVYDNETGLYYLQSRYYDPITGRFLNADIYCDTQTGSPLSTNMFAYCENNQIFAADITGCWMTYLHSDMSKAAGFKGDKYKTVRDWAYKADEYPCESTKYYSTPFHGRSNALDIGKYLYNLALEVKKNKKAYKFSYDKKEGFKKLSGLLNYNVKMKNKKGKDETAKAQNALLKKLNVKDYNKQSQILLGLALHTLQDYFAHVVSVKAVSTTDDFYGKVDVVKYYTKYNLETKKGRPYMMYEIDDIIGIPGDKFEDDIEVFPWRYDTTLSLTKSIYSFWSKGKKIKSITSSTRNTTHTYKIRYHKNGESKAKYWVVTSEQYYISIK